MFHADVFSSVSLHGSIPFDQRQRIVHAGVSTLGGYGARRSVQYRQLRSIDSYIGPHVGFETARTNNDPRRRSLVRASFDQRGQTSGTIAVSTAQTADTTALSSLRRDHRRYVQRDRLLLSLSFEVRNGGVVCVSESACAEPVSAAAQTYRTINTGSLSLSLCVSIFLPRIVFPNNQSHVEAVGNSTRARGTARLGAVVRVATRYGAVLAIVRKKTSVSSRYNKPSVERE